MTPRIVPLAEWPAVLQGYPVAGLHTGGCVDGRRSFRRKAHAHIKGPWKGWICALAAWRLEDQALMLHELAHILTGHGHTNKWRSKLLSIGGTLQATDSLRDYHKRDRQ